MQSFPFLLLSFAARVGGNPNNGANDGLFYWNLNNSFGTANWNYGARVLIKNKKFAYYFPCHLAKIKSKSGLV